MSYLDALLQPDQATIDAALIPIQAEIDATQNTVAALKTEVDALTAGSPEQAAAIAALQAAQTSLAAQLAAVSLSNDTQQLVIDANAALAAANAAAITATNAANATQQSAIEANTAAAAAANAAVTANNAVDSTQAAAIAALQNVVATAEQISTVDLRRFVSGGVLTDANIDDAIDAAIVAAMAATGPAFRGPAPVIVCPAGIWALSRPHVFAGFPGESGGAANRCFIGFRGAGMNETVFVVSTDGGGTPVFTFGNASTVSPNPWTMYLYVGGFSIVAATEDNCIRTGIRVYCAVNPIINRVRVRGLTHPNAQYDQGRAIEILPALGAGLEINSQFVVLKDCDVFACMTGLYARRSYPLLMDNVALQGCHFENAVFEGVFGEWRNSGAQFQGDSSLFPDRWYGRRNMPGIVTGFSRTAGLASSASATCAAAVGYLSLVTIPGANLTIIDRGRWIRLTPAGNSANELKVRGMYKIDSIASATTAWVRKGSNHTTQTGLTAQVCESEVNNELTFDTIYDEATSRIATYGFYRDPNGLGAYILRRPQSFNAGGYIVESDGPARVRVEAPPLANIEKVARLRMTKESFVDAMPSRIEVDDYSHPGHASRSEWQRQLAGIIPSDQRYPYAYRDASGGSAVRLRTALQEMGFLEIWDARVTSSINIVSTDARSWTGLLKGTVLGPTTGALYPLYTPDDPLFGGPCVTMVAGTHLTGRSLKGAIAAANLPSYPYLCTIFTISRAESAAAPPGAEICRVQVTTPDANQFIAFNEGLWAPSGNYVMNEGTGIGNAMTALVPAADVDPHAYVFSRSPDGYNVISTDHGEDYRSHNAHVGAFVASHTVGANLDVVIGGVGATYSHRGFRTVVNAIKIGTLSQAEARKLIDLSRNEFPLEA